MITLEERLEGVIIGTAVGDALGLPFEGIKASRIRKLSYGPLNHRFIFGYGMISDDTEHTIFVGQSLLEHPNDPFAFQKTFARKLRYWLLGVPAGIGFATLKAILRLWCGIPPSRAGVFSAGNGPSMRSAIMGAYFHDDPELRRSYVKASTQVTHTDPKAFTASMAISEAVAWAINNGDDLTELFSILNKISADPEWRNLMKHLEQGIEKEVSVVTFAEQLNLSNSITGYCYHTVPMALFTWLRHLNHFQVPMEEIIRCGGDTDTTAAITGALAGATLGLGKIPEKWIKGLREYPRNLNFFTELSKKLAYQKAIGTATGAVSYFWPALLPRNILFTSIVLIHGARRLLPPY